MLVKPASQPHASSIYSSGDLLNRQCDGGRWMVIVGIEYLGSARAASGWFLCGLADGRCRYEKFVEERTV